MVLPRLLGSTYMHRVKVIITDGDAQETAQLDNAIEKHFPSVCCVRCGWHIVDRGWKQVCPSSNRKLFKVVRNVLKAWIYTWMKADAAVETEEEYKISKALMFAYLGHPDL